MRYNISKRGVMKLKRVEDLKVKDKVVLLRTALNVPIAGIPRSAGKPGR